MITINNFTDEITSPPQTSPSTVGDPLPPSGTTLAVADELEVLSNQGLFRQGFVGQSDPEDFYRFTVPSNGQFGITLNGVNRSPRFCRTTPRKRPGNLGISSV